MVPLLNKLVSTDLRVQVKVPDSVKIGIDTFQNWKNGGDIRFEVEALYDWTEGRSIIVRSSAVRSEDGAESMSPGVFDSKPLLADHSFEDLYQAIIAVYESMNSALADQQKAIKGIDSDLMGLEIQELVGQKEGALKGHIDTVVPHRPELFGVNLIDYPLPPLLKDKIFDGMAATQGESPNDLFFFPTEYNNYFGAELVKFHIWALSQIGFILEKAHGCAQQIEFIFEPGIEPEGERTIWLLQQRPLPKSVMDVVKVEIPTDSTVLYRLRAIGAGDFILDVLSVDDDNTDKVGVVPVKQSYAISESDMKWLPKEGGLIIDEAIVSNHGHLPYLCLDRGLFCLFPAASPSSEMHSLNKKLGLQPDLRARHTSLLEGYTQVRVIIDGLEGVVVAVPKVPTDSNDQDEGKEQRQPAQLPRLESWLQKFMRSVLDWF